MKYKACKHTSTAHITPMHDRVCGNMRLLIKRKAEGEGTAGVPWIKQVKLWQLSNCHTKLHQGICKWLHSYCATDTCELGGSTWRKLFKPNKSVFLLLLLSTVYWHPSILSINGSRPPQEHHSTDMIGGGLHSTDGLCGSAWYYTDRSHKRFLGGSWWILWRRQGGGMKTLSHIDHWVKHALWIYSVSIKTSDITQT